MPFERNNFDPAIYGKSLEVLPLLKVIEEIREKRLIALDADIARAKAAVQWHREMKQKSEARQQQQLINELEEQIPQYRFMTKITDCVGSSTFENLYERKQFGIPAMGTIIRLAKCLNCSTEESNKLLYAAGYPLMPVRSKDTNAHQAMLDYLPIPGYVMDHTWQVVAINKHFLRLFAISESDWAVITHRWRNMLSLLFDERFPFRAGLTTSEAEWRRCVMVNVRAYKTQMSFSPPEMQGDYKAVIELCRQHRDFNEIWDAVDVATSVPARPSPSESGDDTQNASTEAISASMLTYGMNPAIHNVEGAPAVTITTARASIGDFPYPMTMFYMPADVPSREWFTAIGIPTPENGWGTNIPRHRDEITSD